MHVLMLARTSTLLSFCVFDSVGTCCRCVLQSQQQQVHLISRGVTVLGFSMPLLVGIDLRAVLLTNCFLEPYCHGLAAVELRGGGGAGRLESHAELSLSCRAQSEPLLHAAEFSIYLSGAAWLHPAGLGSLSTSYCTLHSTALNTSSWL